MVEIRTKFVRTNDGVNLHCLEAGEGQPIVMIPGWSQTAEQFKFQLDGLSQNYRCIALDMRGHGESDKVDFGYKIQRLAKDIYDVLEDLDLSEVILLGHSMGCSVIWCYWDLFLNHRLSKLILVDQMPFMTANPTWSEGELESSGARRGPAESLDLCNRLAGPAGEAMTSDMIGGMLTSGASPETRDWIIERNLRLSRARAAQLFFNHSVQDWRDVIPRIDLPTLIVGGRASSVSWKSQEWINSQIEGSRLEIFEEEEGGSHFMFIENSSKFNHVVLNFLRQAEDVR